jgi:hypothetical protein
MISDVYNKIEEVDAYLDKKGKVDDYVLNVICLLEEAVRKCFLPMTLGKKLSNVKQKHGIL